MDICHLKNAELEAKHQKYKGRVVLRGDIVKDTSGSNAVFTEQGSSASQMTAQDHGCISRLPGCMDKQQTQYRFIPKSENGRCSQIIENSQIGVSRHLDSSTTTKWPKSWTSMEDPVVPLERNLYGHPLAGLLWERQFEKILLKHGQEKIPNWECLFVHREKGLFLSVYVDDIKLAGKKQNLDPMWKEYSTKKLIWENQHLSWIMCTWAALNDNAKQAKILWTITEPCSNREFQRVVNREITTPSKSSYFFMVL